MNKLTLPTNKVTATPLGLVVDSQLTRDEWKQLGQSIASASRSMAFITGDWLVCSDTLFGVESDPNKSPQHVLFEEASEATGLDIPTLQVYAHVARKVPYYQRSERLSWEHHRVLAKLPYQEQPQWIERCVAELDAGRPMTLRRLRKSINLGRIATIDDLEPDAADRGIENHLTHVNRISAWWGRMQEDLFMSKATPEQRKALKDDLEPVVKIYNQL